MFGPLKNFIFDLDGTLVNTMGLVYRAFIEVLDQDQGIKVTHDELCPHMGKAPHEIFSVWVKDPAALHSTMESWKVWHQRLVREDLPSYDGVAELLKVLHDKALPVFIYTGRDRWSAQYILSLHGWWGKYFHDGSLYTGDQGFPPKPAPNALMEILQKYSLTPSETLFVGDSEKDVQCAVAANVRSAAVLWDLESFEGRTHRQRFKKAWEKWDKESPDLRLVSPRNLIAYLQASDFK